MARLVRFSLLALAVVAGLSGCRSSGFGSLVSAVEAQPGVRKQWIPMLGLARSGVRMIQPSGIYDFRIAIFEHSTLGASNLDRAISSITRRGWSPVVRVAGVDGERTTIWARESPRGVHMLLFARESTETVVVQIELDAERFFRDFALGPEALASKARP